MCLEEMRPPVKIFQCVNGHTLCGQCRDNPVVSTCPSCRVDMASATRNILAESLAEKHFEEDSHHDDKEQEEVENTVSMPTVAKPMKRLSQETPEKSEDLLSELKHRLRIDKSKPKSQEARSSSDRRSMERFQSNEREEDKWVCDFCTFENSHETFLVCEMCEAPRGKEEFPSLDQGYFWQCSACTLYNETKCKVCKACQKQR